MAKQSKKPQRRVLLVGGPDTGKTNYLVRLFESLIEADGCVKCQKLPDIIKYVEQGRLHLAQGNFVPRSAAESLGIGSADVIIEQGQLRGQGAILEMPDAMGETWSEAAQTREIDPVWMDRIKSAEHALLFIRPMSDENVDLLDWVTASEWMRAETHNAAAPSSAEVGAMGGAQGDGDGGAHSADNESDASKLPTQVVTTELLNFLEENLAADVPNARPRVAVIVTSWDLVPGQYRDQNPATFVSDQCPMVSGRIDDCSRIEVEVFGCSIVGGDLRDDPDFRAKYRDMEIVDCGYIAVGQDQSALDYSDMTLPLGWVLGAPLPIKASD